MKRQIKIFIFFVIVGCTVLLPTSCRRSGTENVLVESNAFSRLLEKVGKDEIESGKGPSTYKAFGLVVPAPVVHQWNISEIELSGLSDVTPSDYHSVKRAISEGRIDGMSTNFTTFRFSDDGSELIDGGGVTDAIIPEQIPDFFEIEYEGDLPVRFSLNEKEMDEWLENGGVLDCYDLALKSFTVRYDSRGLPLSLKGMGLGGFFSDGPYDINYRDYEFDGKGNWTRRTLDTPSFSILQFRSYEYR